MRPLTSTQPKVMLPVAGKPMLEQLLTSCCEAGLSEFVFIVGYHDEKVREYFGEGASWGVNIRYAFQRQPAGTADALRQAGPLLPRSFILLNGDILMHSKDILPLCQTEITTMSLVELKDVYGMGVVELEGQNVKRIHEKSEHPPTNFVNTGAYYFAPEIFMALEKTKRSSRGEFEITDTIQEMIDSGIPVISRFITTWQDIGYPWDLLTANEKLMVGLESINNGTIEEGVVIKGAVNIGNDSHIRSGSYIVGPVVIGKGCDIGPNCYIRPTTSIGDGCHIGAGVEVKNSIIMNRSKIPHLTYVGDSVIGENCNFGAGTQIANLRLDKANIRINGRDTGRRKLGAIIGDGVSTGVNSSINPGTVIGSNAFIGPGVTASGEIPPGVKFF